MTNIKLSQQEISALRGTNVLYRYSVGGITTDIEAFVSQADKNKGITIMGNLPKGMDRVLDKIHGNDKDVILCCCNSHGDVNERYIEVINRYIDNIKAGIIIPVGIDCGTGRNLSGTCAFGG